jgi:hypothetical protein
VVVARNAAGFGADPEFTIDRARHRIEPISSDALRIAAIKRRKTNSIESSQAVHGCQPKIAFVSLTDSSNGVHGETVIGGPLINGDL